MKSDVHELSFARIAILEENLAEVIVNEGVVITVPMVEEYHEFLRSHLKAPIKLLVHRLHQYHYEAEAQRIIGDIPEIAARAVVAYDSLSEARSFLLTVIPGREHWVFRMFDNRTEALEWLQGFDPAADDDETWLRGQRLAGGGEDSTADEP